MSSSMEKEFQHIQSILVKVLHKNKELQHALTDFDTKAIIKQVLGEPILSYIQEIGLKGNTIIIRTHQSVLRQEIQSHQSVLLDRINQQLPTGVLFDKIEVRS